MIRKIVTFVLLLSFLVFLGCYDAGLVTKEELKARAEQADATLVTKDLQEYKFLKGNYRIQGDTLKGFGVRTSNGSSKVILDASLPLSDMTSIRAGEVNATKTILLCGGAAVGASVVIYLLIHENTPSVVSVPSGGGGPQ